MDIICYISPGLGAMDVPALRLALSLDMGQWETHWPGDISELARQMDQAVLTDETLLLMVPARRSELEELLAHKPELVRYETVVILEGECRDSLATAHQLFPRVLLTGALPTGELLAVLSRLAHRMEDRRPNYLTSRLRRADVHGEA